MSASGDVKRYASGCLSSRLSDCAGKKGKNTQAIGMHQADTATRVTARHREGLKVASTSVLQQGRSKASPARRRVHLGDQGSLIDSGCVSGAKLLQNPRPSAVGLRPTASSMTRDALETCPGWGPKSQVTSVTSTFAGRPRPLNHPRECGHDQVTGYQLAPLSE